MREVAYLAVWAIDWAQTRYIATHSDRFYEQANVFLGNHPEEDDVNRYFLTVGALQLGVAHVLPPAWRPFFQQVTISQHYTWVESNYQLGIQLKF